MQLKIIVMTILVFVLSACQVVSTNKPNAKPNYAQAYQNYIRLGAEYMQKGHYDLAEPKLKRAIEIDARPPEAWNMLAVLYEEMRNVQQANQIYQKLINSHKDYELGYFNYGSFLCKFSRDEDRLSLYEKMRVKGGDFLALSYISDGNCLKSRSDNKGAKKAYLNALSLDPQAPGALLPLAEIAVDQKEYLQALNYINVVHTYVGYTPATVRLSIMAARGAGNKSLENQMIKILKTNYFDSNAIDLLGL